MYEYLEELGEMNWSARGNVLNQYLRNTSIGTTVKVEIFNKMFFLRKIFLSGPDKMLRRQGPPGKVFARASGHMISKTQAVSLIFTFC